MRRPLSVTVIAWYFLVTSILAVILAVTSGRAGGVDFLGEKYATLLYIYSTIGAVVGIFVGIGLLRLDNLARIVAMVSTAIHILLAVAGLLWSPVANDSGFRIGLISGLVISGAVIFDLLKKRSYFIKTT